MSKRIYTVIVGRPDYVSGEDPLADTYMTSLRASNAKEAGEWACVEAAEQDSDDPEDANDPGDYTVVAVIRGNHQDINGRSDL